jgi:mannobiose 2-epimerase
MVMDSNDLAEKIHRELVDDLVPFWLQRSLDRERGGFVGRVASDLSVDPSAPKALILNARILWSFSAFYRTLGDADCLHAAQRAFEYLERHFWDPHHGGAYWSVDAAGRPRDEKKKVYGQAFLIYALAEYHRASGEAAPLARAVELFELVERYTRDRRHGGYVETYERDWTVTSDLRLSDTDMNAKKSMNAHLHLLEAFTGLHASWPDAGLRQRLGELLSLFLDHIVDPHEHRFAAFFDDDWTVQSSHISPGHDIEGSWLLWESAEALGDVALADRVRAEALEMARTVLRTGVDADGGVWNELDVPGGSAKDWWPQAEGVVGFLNAFELSGDRAFFDAATGSWRFIQDHVIDRQRGEWHWRVLGDGKVDRALPKISEWKCPYHNGRMCIEAGRRLQRLGSPA